MNYIALEIFFKLFLNIIIITYNYFSILLLSKKKQNHFSIKPIKFFLDFTSTKNIYSQNFISYIMLYSYDLT